MTQGMRSVPLTNMGPFRREPQQCSMSHCSLEWCVSCLSVAMMNTMMEATCRTKHLFQLVIREGESPFLAGKAAVGAERWVTISSLQRKQREGAWGWSTGSGARHTSPYRFRSLPKQHQPLKTKCKSTWAYEGHVTFKPTQKMTKSPESPARSSLAHRVILGNGITWFSVTWNELRNEAAELGDGHFFSYSGRVEPKAIRSSLALTSSTWASSELVAGYCFALLIDTWVTILLYSLVSLFFSHINY